MALRISLNEEEFTSLVKGEVVKFDLEKDGKSVRTEIALQDIGFGRMIAAVSEAHAEATDRTVADYLMGDIDPVTGETHFAKEAREARGETYEQDNSG